MRLYVLLCLLQLHLFNVEGIDIPRQKIIPRRIKYTTGDTLNIQLVLSKLNELPSHEHWTVTLISVSNPANPLRDGNTGNTAYTTTLGQFRRSSSSAEVTFSRSLTVQHDRTEFFVHVENEEAPEYYEEKIITLLYQERPTEMRDECLRTKCSIVVEIWNPKRLTISLITKPKLSNITYYQIGDRFSHSCTATAQSKRSTISWIRRKDGLNFNTSLSTASIDIVLDESFNNTDIWCVASFMNKLYFEDVFVTSQPAAPWPTISIAAVVAAVALTALATLAYFYRKRKLENTDSVVEVQNELYGSKCDLQYAQLYAPRLGQGAPPPTPHFSRTPYSNIIGFLK